MHKKKGWGLIGRALMEVLVFCFLTGCAYQAAGEVLPMLESQTVSVETEETEVPGLQKSAETPKPEGTEVLESIDSEKEMVITKVRSIPSEGLFGEEIIQEMTYEDAVKLGNIVLEMDTSYEKEGAAGLLPGIGQGTWYGIDVDGISYIYGYYSEIGRNDFFTYMITDEKHILSNGLRVGLTGDEALKLCPELVKIELTADNWHWNAACYPKCWIEQFEYALVVDLENGAEDLPVYLALFMKNDKVVAISPYYPTAG